MNSPHPPGPKINTVFAVIAPFIPFLRKFDMLAFAVNNAQLYGDMVYYKIGPYEVYIVNHPDHAHEVLVKGPETFSRSEFTSRVFRRFLGEGLLVTDGEFWKRQRRLEQPAFHYKRIQMYADVMVAHTEWLLNHWRDGAEMDIAEEMMKLTLGIVAKTLFDADVTGDSDAVGRAMTDIQEVANAQFTSVVSLPEWLPTPQNLRQQRATRMLDDILMRIINERRKTSEDKGDLLSMLLLAQDEDGSGMSDKQVRDEAMTLFLAGHETTSNALSWTWYLLSQHPEVEARLQAELDTVLNGRAPTIHDLPQLQYTEMVIKESMRLYPPAFGLSREAAVDTTLAGYSIRKGSIIAIYPYIIHRDARWFPDPERFDPERFSEENEKLIPKYAYFPFGGGPHTCIGNQFAMMEARLILATIAQRYRLSLVPGHNVKPEPLITLRPKYGMKMTLRQRERVPAPANPV